MVGGGLPLALQNKFVVEDSFTVGFPVELTISGRSEINAATIINSYFSSKVAVRTP